MLLDKAIGSPERISVSVTKSINAISVFFLTMMMIVVTVDVLSRYFFNLPIEGSLEMLISNVNHHDFSHPNLSHFEIAS